MKATADYGKLNVTVYRTHAPPLRVAPIPESSFTVRENELFALAVDLDAFGEAFLPAYTEGDNRAVVATDTMKNFVHAMALESEAATPEAFLAFVGRRFLEAYRHAAGVQLRARELAFTRLEGGGEPFFRRARGDAGVAEVRLDRRDGRVAVAELRSGREGVELARLRGSSFEGFVRDQYTTLPETKDRPLVMRLDLRWRYRDVEDAIGAAHDGYVASEQVRDIAEGVFGTFASRSIQHLVHEMGQRILERFTQLEEVSLDAENRLWDTARVRDDRVAVYTDARAAYGRIGLTLRR